MICWELFTGVVAILNRDAALDISLQPCMLRLHNKHEVVLINVNEYVYGNRFVPPTPHVSQLICPTVGLSIVFFALRRKR